MKTWRHNLNIQTTVCLKKVPNCEHQKLKVKVLELFGATLQENCNIQMCCDTMVENHCSNLIDGGCWCVASGRGDGQDAVLVDRWRHTFPLDTRGQRKLLFKHAGPELKNSINQSKSNQTQIEFSFWNKIEHIIHYRKLVMGLLRVSLFNRHVIMACPMLPAAFLLNLKIIQID
jgi:hypothetical protein